MNEAPSLDYGGTVVKWLKVAHQPAQLAFSLSDDCFWLEEYPPNIHKFGVPTWPLIELIKPALFQKKKN